MKKRVFSYFITPFGVLSFTDKYVFINCLKTKSAFKVYSLLEKFDPFLFGKDNRCLFWLFDYDKAKGVLLRFLRSGRYDHRVTEVFDSSCHSAKDIFHGQYSDWPIKFSVLTF